jgi:hypothetical protein
LPALLLQFLSYLRHQGLTSESQLKTTRLQIRTVLTSLETRLLNDETNPKGNFPLSRDDSKVLASETGNMPKYKCPLVYIFATES